MPIVLSENARLQIKGNHRITGRLMTHLNRAETTIQKYARKNDPRLATQHAAEIIAQETGMKIEDILIDQPLKPLHAKKLKATA
jgi:hypothetical protein